MGPFVVLRFSATLRHMKTHLSDEQLKADAVVALRASLTKAPRLRGSYYRTAADLLVELRSRHDYEGSPDWGGKSWHYRDAVREVYEAAGLDADQSSAKASVRYHIGNVLRERVPSSELEEAGLFTESPRERHFKSQRPDAEGSEGYASGLITQIFVSSGRLDAIESPDVSALDVDRVSQSLVLLRRWLARNA